MIILTPVPCLAAGESRPLDTCLPAKVLVAYFGRPSPEMLDAPPGGSVDRLAGLVITLKAIGVIPREGRIIADIMATLPMLGRRPHAFALLDITAKKLRPGSYRLNNLQAALLVDVGEMSEGFDRRVRDLLATYTDAENARIEAVQVGQVGYHRLIDRRLPDWAVIEWGFIGEHFLVTMGTEVFQIVVDTLQRRSASLADDPWYARAHQKTRGATSGIEVFTDLEGIRRRMEEVVQQAKLTEVISALHLEEVERLCWTTGFDGRALRSEIVAEKTNGSDEHVILTGKDVAAPEVTSAIPPEASGYAAFRFPLPAAVRDARQAYMQSRSPGARRRFSQGWTRLEQEFNFDVETEFIDQLGDHLIFHTYPVHPLGLPMLLTIWIQVGGDQAEVSRTVDRMMSAWQRYVNSPAETKPALPETRPAIGLSPQIKRTDDDIWYLQLGLVGPAMTVTDGWIVISYSPEAVRQNMAHLKMINNK